MRFVKTDKGDFVGREHTIASAEAALPWVCAYLAIEADGHHDGHGGEAVLMNGEKVGSTSSMALAIPQKRSWPLPTSRRKPPPPARHLR